MPFWPPSLVREVAERRVVFFVGAGLSKTALGTFPSWKQLLDDLAEMLSRQKDKKLVRKLACQGNMLDAAQIIRDGAPRADLSAKLREKFQIRPAPHHPVYENLLLMDPKIIITTNYDELLEKNFEHFSGGTASHSIIKHQSDNLINDLRSPMRTIIKLHGCISDPADLILERSSYFNARRNNPGLFGTVASLMTINTVIFIGYSISDPDIQLTLENINLYSQSSNPHYALMSKFESRAIRDANTHSYNVSFLEYASGAHGMVPDLLDDLKNQVLDLRSSLGVP